MVVPIGVAGIVWQLLVLPKLPPTRAVSVIAMVRLLRSRTFAVGTAATTLAFMGQFALSTYFRPFLESVTGLDVNALSLFLLGLGVAGLVGTALIGHAIRSSLNATLIGLPALMAVVALLFVARSLMPLLPRSKPDLFGD